MLRRARLDGKFFDAYATRQHGDTAVARKVLARRLESSPDNPALRELPDSLN